MAFLFKIFGWFVRLPLKIKAGITTAEFALALGAAGVAWSVGGDMILIATAITIGWILGAVGVATISSLSPAWKATIIVLIAIIFATEGGFLYWHFHEADARALVARWTEKTQTPVVFQQQMTPAPGQKLVSRATKFIFACDLPPTQTMTATEIAAKKDEIQRNAKAFGDLLGFSIYLSEIEGGYRVSVTPATDEGRNRFTAAGVWPSVQSVNLDMRRIGEQIIVAV